MPLSEEALRRVREAEAMRGNYDLNGTTELGWIRLTNAIIEECARVCYERARRLRARAAAGDESAAYQLDFAEEMGDEISNLKSGAPNA